MAKQTLEQRAKALCKLLDVPDDSFEFRAIVEFAKNQHRHTVSHIAKGIGSAASYESAAGELMSKNQAYNIVMNCREGLE